MMATVAGVVTVVMGFAAALLLYEATATKPRHEEGRQAGERRAMMRKYGIVAAVVAVIAAYVAALS